MIRFSANLGFLWTDLALVDAINAAHRAGFDAVECHHPYATCVHDVTEALQATGLTMLGINTERGANGANGMAAIAGAERVAQAHIDQAIDYAASIGCRHIHVMAGSGTQTCEATFRKNLALACDKARNAGLTILVEPLNLRDVPAYHLSTLDAALETLDAVAKPNLKIMFDCYHMQIMHGDLLRRLESCLPHVGHIQIAAVPDRCEPHIGEVNYRWLLQQINELGWQGHFGAEYRPTSTTDAGLGWLTSLR